MFYVFFHYFQLQVKRFKRILKKADQNSCPVHSIPSESIESLRPLYTSGKIFANFVDYG